MFGEKLRQERTDASLSLRVLASLVPCDPGFLSKLENDKRRPSEAIAARLDEILKSRGELIAVSRLDASAAVDDAPWATSELVQRIQSTDTTPATLDSLRAAVVELSCAYTRTPAAPLRREVHSWLRRLNSLLNKPTSLHAHREVLVSAGWLALLAGCLEYDLGMRASAEVTRMAAGQLGSEAEHPELTAWAAEMSAWFALTQGRYRDALAAASAGLTVAGRRPVAVQLHAHQAKALGRMGELDDARRALDNGRALLVSLHRSEREDSHFSIDPPKWDIYATDAYRVMGDDAHAEEFARRALVTCAGHPMRVAEATLTLAAVAARKDELEEAVSVGISAFDAPRKSLPSLVLVAGELESELSTRFPHEAATERFREAVRHVRA